MLHVACKSIASWALIVCVCLPASPVAANFYEGKTLNFVINFTPGGPTDFEGRLVARHLGKHIVGNPTIIVRNMPGAGGAIGLNWLGQVAGTDGLTVGYLAGVTTKVVMGDPAIKVDVRNMKFIAGVPGVSVTYIRRDVPPGINKPLDIMRSGDFWAGGLTPESAKDVRMRMQLDLLGVRYRYVSGYPGAAEARLAFQRGEIHLTAETIPTYRASIEPALVNTGEAIPLWLDPLDDGDALTQSPDADGIPADNFYDFYKKAMGKEPQGELWESYRVINGVSAMFLRLIMMPAGAPDPAVSSIKAALANIQNSTEYRDEAMKGMRFVPSYISDSRSEKRFLEVLEPPPAIRSFLRAYIEKGKQASTMGR